MAEDAADVPMVEEGVHKAEADAAIDVDNTVGRMGIAPTMVRSARHPQKVTSRQQHLLTSKMVAQGDAHKTEMLGRKLK